MRVDRPFLPPLSGTHGQAFRWRHPFLLIGADSPALQDGEGVSDDALVRGTGSARVGGCQRCALRGTTDGLGEVEFAAERVFEISDGPAIGGFGEVGGEHRSLFVQPGTAAGHRSGSDLAGGVGEGGDVQQVRLTQVGREAGWGIAALVDLMGEAELILFQAARAPPAGHGDGLLRARQRLHALGSGEGVTAGAEPGYVSYLQPDLPPPDLNVAEGAIAACRAARSPRAYTAFRRLLITRPVLTVTELAALAAEVNLMPVFEVIRRSYERAPASYLTREGFQLCGRCGCLLVPLRNGGYRCELDRCRNDGGTALGPVLPATTGVLQLSRPLRVFITSPGLAETDL